MYRQGSAQVCVEHIFRCLYLYLYMYTNELGLQIPKQAHRVKSKMIRKRFKIVQISEESIPYIQHSSAIIED